MYLPFGIIAAITFMADQVCKWLVRKHIPLGASHEVLPGKLAITHIRNYGAANGFLSDSPKALMILTITAIWGEVQTFLDLSKDFKFHKPAWVLFGLSVGGSASNVLDRLSENFVTDCIHVCPPKRTPIFNIADVCILVGTIGLLIIYLKRFILTFRTK